MRLPRLAHLRIMLLLGCLVTVGVIGATQHVQSRSWSEALPVVIYPLNGDGAAATDAYIAELDGESFNGIETWGRREAARHGLPLSAPFSVTLGEEINTLPPAFPADATAASVAWWSLTFRYWAWRHAPDDSACPGVTCVRLFTLYHQGRDGEALAHSLGMQKGLLGMINAFARPEQAGQNDIVIAHELLHTLGATDRYLANGQPTFPEGYASPDASPRYPQRHAEIMAGRTALSPTRFVMPNSLRDVRINDYTATEINWFATIHASLTAP